VRYDDLFQRGGWRENVGSSDILRCLATGLELIGRVEKNWRWKAVVKIRLVAEPRA
jgi:hypothetical protein